MMKAIEMLMNEHRLIEQVLASMETFVGSLEKEAGKAREAVRDYAKFLREFADKRHHGKEEDLLFPEMNAHGFPRDVGPVAVMLAEHVQSREHVRALAAIGEGSGALSPDEQQQVRSHTLQYIPLLREHIQKEDNILYPMAVNTLPAKAMDGLFSQFEEFEADVMTPGVHEQLHTLAGSLVAAYPPDPSRSDGSTCGHG